MDELIVEPRAGWACLTLNRPAFRNALNTALLEGIAAELDRLRDDADCRVVLMHGAAGHFAAGADIGEIETKTAADAARDPRKSYWSRIRAFPKPVVAAIDGFCLGGGFELALMADCLVLGETARLGLPETNLGIMPGAGGSQRLTALVGRARATRMVLFGEIIDAEMAEAWGIAGWRVQGSAMPAAEELCEKLASRAPLALMAAKRAIVQGDEGSLAFTAERSAFEALFDSADKKEGIAAFRAKRKAEFKGA
jgi:enoyl-CoA hydratase